MITKKQYLMITSSSRNSAPFTPAAPSSSFSAPHNMDIAAPQNMGMQDGPVEDSQGPVEDPGTTNRFMLHHPQLLSYQEALNMTMVPIEEGEKCHVCNCPATREGLHIAWCDDCAAVMVARNGLAALGPAHAIPIRRHAFEHAHRWYRMVWRYRILRAKQDGA